jgi:hypothetical protein
MSQSHHAGSMVRLHRENHAEAIRRSPMYAAMTLHSLRAGSRIAESPVDLLAR